MSDLFAAQIAQLEKLHARVNIEIEIEQERLRLFQLEQERFRHLISRCANSTECTLQALSITSDVHQAAVNDAEVLDNTVPTTLAAFQTTEESYFNLAAKVQRLRRHILTEAGAKFSIADKAQKAVIAAMKHEAMAATEREAVQFAQELEESQSTGHTVESQQVFAQRQRTRSIVHAALKQGAEAQIRASDAASVATADRAAIHEKVERARMARAKKVDERRLRTIRCCEALRRVVVAVIRRHRGMRLRLRATQTSLVQHQYASRMSLVVEARAIAAGVHALGTTAQVRVKAAAAARARQRRAAHVRAGRLPDNGTSNADAECDAAAAAGAVGEAARTLATKAYVSAAMSARTDAMQRVTATMAKSDLQSALRERKHRRERVEADRMAAACSDAARKLSLRREIVLGILAIGRRAVAGVRGVQRDFAVVEQQLGLSMRQAFFQSEDAIMRRQMVRAKDLIDQQRALQEAVQERVLAPAMRDVRDAVRQVRGAAFPMLPDGLSATDSFASLSETRSVGGEFAHVIQDLFGVRLPSFNSRTGAAAAGWGASIDYNSLISPMSALSVASQTGRAGPSPSLRRPPSVGRAAHPPLYSPRAGPAVFAPLPTVGPGGAHLAVPSGPFGGASPAPPMPPDPHTPALSSTPAPPPVFQRRRGSRGGGFVDGVPPLLAVQAAGGVPYYQRALAPTPSGPLFYPTPSAAGGAAHATPSAFGASPWASDPFNSSEAVLVSGMGMALGVGPVGLTALSPRHSEAGAHSVASGAYSGAMSAAAMGGVGALERRVTMQHIADARLQRALHAKRLRRSMADGRSSRPSLSRAGSTASVLDARIAADFAAASPQTVIPDATSPVSPSSPVALGAALAGDAGIRAADIGPEMAIRASPPKRGLDALQLKLVHSSYAGNVSDAENEGKNEQS